MSLVQFPRPSRREEEEFTGSISGTEWERGAGACRFDSRHQTNTFFSLSPSHRSPSALFFFLPGLPTTQRGLAEERGLQLLWKDGYLFRSSRSPSCNPLSGCRTYLIWSNHPAMQKEWLLSKGKTSRTWQFSSQYAESLQVRPSSAMRQRSESRMVPIYQLCRWRNAYHKSRRKSLWNPPSNMAENPDWHASASFHQGCSGDSHGMRQHQWS